MPPRKQLPEAPVIFSLRLPTEGNLPVPAGSTDSFVDVTQSSWSEPGQTPTTYAEILSTVETSRIADRFNTDTMKEILARTRSPA